MSKRATVEPRWLDSMLVQWGLRDVRQALKGLGYYRINPMLKSGIPSTAPSYEPNEITPAEYESLTVCIEGLDAKYQLVIMRAYKPWRAAEVEDLLRERYPVDVRTWQRWLHDAASVLHEQMKRAA